MKNIEERIERGTLAERAKEYLDVFIPEYERHLLDIVSREDNARILEASNAYRGILMLYSFVEGDIHDKKIAEEELNG